MNNIPSKAILMDEMFNDKMLQTSQTSFCINNVEHEKEMQEIYTKQEYIF